MVLRFGDTALRQLTRYLTRRLVDVAQDVIVREEDCGTTEGLEVKVIESGGEVIEPLEERLIGRVALEDIVDENTGEVLAKADTELDEDTVERIVAAGITKAKIRSVLNCRTRHGVCRKCYGRDMATRGRVEIGEAVGIIAAQSIGEPGTQLTMRTFHTGGVAGDDITQGLPRVEELFEARKPKGQALISEIDGTVSIEEEKGRKKIIITGDDGEQCDYAVAFGSRIKVRDAWGCCRG